jgi:uncharacterized protein (DUF433 family)
MVANSNLISIDSEIRFGKPCIKGTRICVNDILEWLASGMTNQEILNYYPLLSEEVIFATFSFSANRKAMIKTIIV